jgi:hypothetical protein
MTIGSELNAVENKVRTERILRRSVLLRKFVKEDLLAALTAKVQTDAGLDTCPTVLAPKEIRHLFAGIPEWGDQMTSRMNPRSPYAAVWKELEDWVDSEGLELVTGIEIDRSERWIAHEKKNWGGYLEIKRARPVEPVKPTPPPLQKVSNGFDIPPWLFWFAGMAFLGMCLMFGAGAFK